MTVAIEPQARAAAPRIPFDAMRTALWLIAAAVIVPVVGLAAIDFVALGPLASHMSAHILLMNAAAPIIAIAAMPLLGEWRRMLASGRVLALATVAQLVLLWVWHAPAAMLLAAREAPVHALMQGSLFAAALLFWMAILADRKGFRLRALLALLLTGKLFCLLGVLLVFAPRLIYPALVHAGHAPHAAELLADQHLAGLLMLIACPFTYVLASVAIAAQWLSDLASRSEGPIVPQPPPALLPAR